MTEKLRKGLTKAPAHWIVALGAVAAIGVIPSGPATLTTLSENASPLIASSSAPLDLSLTETPGMALINVAPSTTTASAVVFVSGLHPNASYHFYRESFRNHEMMTADSLGRVSINIDTSAPRLLIISTTPSTRFISDDATGGDCSLIGTWTPVTKTCTLTEDVDQTIEIESNGITLDGAGHTLRPETPSMGVFVNQRTDVAVRNLFIENTSFGLFANASTRPFFENNTISGGSFLISLGTTIDAIVRGNTLMGDDAVGTCIRMSGFGLTRNANSRIENNALSGCDRGIDGFLLSGTVIISNTIEHTTNAISLLDIATLTMADNILTDNQYSFSLADIQFFPPTLFTIPDTNLSDGKPFIFRSDLIDEIFTPASPIAGFVCVLCERVTLREADISKAGTAVLFTGGRENRVERSHLSGNERGVRLQFSPVPTLVENTFIDHDLFAVQVSSSLTTSRNIFMGGNPFSLSTGNFTRHIALPLPDGGNYYEIYDEPAEGCFDADNDKICDDPFEAEDAIDSFPWTMANAWEEPPTAFLSNGAVSRPKGVANKDPFTFTVTYAHPDNIAPASISVSTGATSLFMQPDLSAPPALRDGNFTNGEQYAATATFPKGEFTFSFEGTATDGTPLSLSNPSFTFQAGYSSIIFLPGVKGSELFRDEDRLWFPSTKFSNDVRQLAMDGAGESVVNGVFAKNIFEKVVNPFGGDTEIYEPFVNDLLNRLVQQGQIADVSSLPYDWRYDVRDIVGQGITTSEGASFSSMNTALEDLASRSDSGKVLIISHSNGGLVGKALLSTLEEEGNVSLVEKFVMVATPQLGTPLAIPGLLHGYDEGVRFFVSTSTARFAAQNMRGAQGLLPIGNYNLSTPPIITFVSGPFIIATQKFTDAYGPTIDSPTELQDFLRGTWADSLSECSDSDAIPLNEPICLSTLLLNLSKQTRQFLESWTPPAGIEVFEFAGTNRPTIASINYKHKGECNPMLESCLAMEPQPTGTGDGTVILHSAQAQSGAASFVVDMEASPDFQHRDILNISSLQSMLEQIVTSSNPSLPPGIYPKGTNFPVQNYKAIKVFSPVTLRLEDGQGNVTEAESIPDLGIRVIKEGVPGSQYFSVGETQMIIVPAGTEHQLSIIGTGTGTLQLELEQYEGGVLVFERIHENIPVTPELIGTFIFADIDDIGDILIDTDGDGTNDVVLKPKTPQDVLNELKATIESLEIHKGLKTALLAHVRNIERTLERDKRIRDRVLPVQIRVFERVVQIYHRLRLLSDQEKETIIGFLDEFEELLEN